MTTLPASVIGKDGNYVISLSRNVAPSEALYLPDNSLLDFRWHSFFAHVEQWQQQTPNGRSKPWYLIPALMKQCNTP
ncbi:hypothetical protein XENTR_v10000971 [Xenopus tropicalis]|nr:hypothetical protein XENTR_v10000971 [Xenopus tropicalis]